MTGRRYGAATARVREKQPGVWEVTVSTGRDPATGRYGQKSPTVRAVRRRGTKGYPRRVTDVIHQLEATAGGADRTARTRVTLGRLVDDHITHQAEQWGARKTVVGYEPLAEPIKAAFAQAELRRLTSADLDRWYPAITTWRCAGPGKAPNTVAHHHALFSQALNLAIDRQWLDRSPARKARAPDLVLGDTQPPTSTRCAAWCSRSSPPTRTSPRSSSLAATTSCRRGELRALRWSNVDLEAGQLLVTGSVSDAGGQIEEDTTPEGGNGVALDEASVAMLAGQRARALERCEPAHVRLAPNAFVWSQEPDHSEPWRPDRVTHTSAGSGPGSTSSTSSCATSATSLRPCWPRGGGRAAGGRGHDPSIFLKVYSHLTATSAQEVVAVLGAPMASTPDEPG